MSERTSERTIATPPAELASLCGDVCAVVATRGRHALLSFGLLQLNGALRGNGFLERDGALDGLGLLARSGALDRYGACGRGLEPKL